jgi:small subunit ribosomal protein S21
MTIKIEVKGNIERALRMFKKQMMIEGIQKELRQRRFYEKPSIRKKRKRLEASRRRRKTMIREGRMYNNFNAR